MENLCGGSRFADYFGFELLFLAKSAILKGKEYLYFLFSQGWRGMIPLGTCHESSEGLAGWASIVIGTIVVGGRLSKGNTNSNVQKVITDERSNRLFLIEYLEWSNSFVHPFN